MTKTTITSNSKTMKEKSLYERAKLVQEDFFEIGKSLEFIKLALQNDCEIESSQYNKHLISDMLDGLRGFADNSGDELYLNLGLKEPKEATSGEV